MMCAIHGGTSPASHIEEYQRNCQKELAVCFLSKGTYTPVGKQEALLKCIKERK